MPTDADPLFSFMHISLNYSIVHLHALCVWLCVSMLYSTTIIHYTKHGITLFKLFPRVERTQSVCACVCVPVQTYKYRRYVTLIDLFFVVVCALHTILVHTPLSSTPLPPNLPESFIKKFGRENAHPILWCNLDIGMQPIYPPCIGNRS